MILIVSNDIYLHLIANHYDHTIMSCGCATDGKPVFLWSVLDTSFEDDIVENKAYYLHSVWCTDCGDIYLSEILNKF